MKILATLCLCLLPMLVQGQELGLGTGQFSFRQYPKGAPWHVPVYYHIPAGDAREMPILFAFHGEERDAEGAMTDWIAAADAHGFIVAAPQFTDSLFPGGDGYNLAGIFVNGDAPTSGTLRPDSLWAYAVLDPLFQFIKAQTGSRAAGYVAFGHSAGAQFVERMLLFKPGLMQAAICANAGWYCMPDSTVGFPYGLAASPCTEVQRAQAFASNLVVMLGQSDISPTSYNLRHTAGADAQGLNRLARGHYFYSQSQALARTAGLPFAWRTAEVAGVGHDHTAMARNAVGFVLDGFGSTLPDYAPDVSAGFAANAFQVDGLHEGETGTIDVYTSLGQYLGSVQAAGTGRQTIPFAAVATGIYLARARFSAHAERQFTFYVSNL